MFLISKSIVIAILVSTLTQAASYVVPLEYDNIRLSVKSSGYGIILGTTPKISNNTYKIGGKDMYYRCLVVPKVKCATGLASITPSLSEVSIRHATTGEVVTLWSADIRVEEDGPTNVGNWYICGAAYGGEKSDSSIVQVVENLDASGKKDGSRNLKYDYKPNINRHDIFAFVKNIPTYTSADIPAGANVSSNTAHATSFMTVEYRQVCR